MPNRFYAYGVLCFIAACVIAMNGVPRVHRYNCFQKLDGSVYCYAEDGHLFRPRFDKFTIEVQ